MSVYFLAPLIGVVVGLRAMAAPAVVSWAAYLRRMHLEGAWLAFLGYAWPPYILSALAISELISDQLPKTPSRKVPMQYGARVVTGAGAALGASRGAWMGGLVAGAIGAVAGTLGGYEFRTRLVAAIGGKDLPTALLEDVIAIGGAVLIVRSFLVTRTFDAIIIGAGQAGPSLAGRLTGAGKSVALTERKLIGGTCVNTGCTPTKTLVASAYVAYLARRAAEYGLTIGGPVGVDMKALKARKDAVLGRSRVGLEAWLKGMANCTVYEGHAHFEAPHEVRVGEELLSANRIFINVGGRALVPDMPGLDKVSYLTNASILELDVLPRHLVIVGGSYVGLEFAQMYRRFGSEVTVVEKGPRLIQHEDEDVSAAVKNILEAEGIRIRLHAECISFALHSADIAVGVDCESGDREVVGSHVLLAVGRRPNTDDLGLDKAGVETDKRGYIVVDDKLRTSVPGIWALGDCNGKGAFTHTSYNDFEITAANLLDDDCRRVSDRLPAYALYVDPPLGRAGLTEAEARQSGKHILVGRRPMSRVARAVEKGETQGFIKIVVDADSHQILGAAILGVGADEVVHGILDIMYAKAPYTALQRAMHIHPTVSELVPTVLSELKPLL